MWITDNPIENSFVKSFSFSSPHIYFMLRVLLDPPEGNKRAVGVVEMDGDTSDSM